MTKKAGQLFRRKPLSLKVIRGHLVDALILCPWVPGSPILDVSGGSVADPGLQALNPQVINNKASSRLPLDSSPAVTYSAPEHHAILPVSKQVSK